MDKDRELTGVTDLLKHLDGWSIVIQGESPDFVLENYSSKERVGVEVTEYYPNRTKKGCAIVRIKGKDSEESDSNKYRFFEKTELGYSRLVPSIDVDDFQSKCLTEKEKKLPLYRTNACNCKEFWLLVMLSFYDNIVYENISSISTLFDKVYIWEEPGRVYSMPIDNSNALLI